ncbi:TonB-dependent receptor plug domain-containing protein [Costertonia aggregata]|uniref:TonB-dependent receptor n=1 Tax=Costertonia aggregata TaxID=343403 RepID=A0A7H9AS34_9FLAO|nr:TonB-dependent receptor [Costertonia aggregata]QLG46288.1 TonB-dependent receptor [Costertonia aggregata]
MNLNRLLAFVFISVSGASLYAQEKPLANDSILVQDLEEVIVTATRTVRQLSSVPLPVTLISKKQLKKTGVIRLDEILNEQTGIITVADESGFNGIQVQGIASDYVMILIDGVPLVGRSAGNFDLSRLTVGNIQQIEIVKGPSSSLYGSEALGGVVNIITETPKDSTLHGNVSHRIASFNTHDSNINIKQKFKKLGYSLFANSLFSDGYDLVPENPGQTVEPFNNYTLNGRIFYDFTKNLRLFTSGRYYKQEQESSLFLGDELLEGDSNLSEANLHLRLNHGANAKLDFEYEFYYTNYIANEFLQSPITQDTFSESDFNQNLFRPEVRAMYAIKPNNTVTLGVGYNHENLDRTFFDERVTFDSQYVYAQYDFYPLEKINMILGARFDNHSEYQSQFSPKASLNYAFNDNISLKGSIGYGFKAPDFRQLYFDFTNSAVGYTVLGYNVAVAKVQELEEQGQLIDILFDLDDLAEPLQAESSVGYNLGAAYQNGKLRLGLNYFRNDFQNLIDTRAIARRTNGQNVFSYVNFDRIYTTGLELDINYKVSNTLTLAGGYQLLYAKDKEKKVALERGEVFARDPASLQTVALDNTDYFGLVNRSRHTANFKMFYEVPRWNFNANLRINYRSKYGLFDSNGNGIIDDFDTSFVDGFALTNIALNKTFAGKYTLQLGANNLFDYRDEENIPGLAGIQLFTKVNIQF